MQEHDFEKGGVIYGKFYPGLKPVATAIRKSKELTGMYVHYEPGNGTRYEVIFSRMPDGFGGTQVVLTVICPKLRSMIISGPMFPDTSIGYMMEKMPGMYEGDCYALIPLINQFLEENGS